MGGVQHRLPVGIGGAAAPSDRKRQRTRHQTLILLPRIAREHARVLPEILVHARIPLIRVDGGSGASYVVVLPRRRVARLVRSGVVGRDFLSHRIHSAGRDHVPWKWRPLARAVGQSRQSIGIVDQNRRAIAGQGLRKIPGLLRVRGNRGGERQWKPLPQAFVVGEEERLVPDDGAARVAPELMPLERRVRDPRAVVEPVVGLYEAVPLEIVPQPVNVVRPGLGDHVDNAARSAPEFRVVAVLLHLELLHRIHRRIDDAAIHVGGGVGRAVQQEFLRTRPSSSHIEIRLEEVPAQFLPSAIAEVRAERHPRRQAHQRQRVAHVQRQVLDLLRIHHRANRRRRCLQQFGGRRHLNLFAGVAYLQHDIQRQHIVHLQRKRTLLGGLEAGVGRNHSIARRLQSLQTIDPFAVRCRAFLRAGGDVGGGHPRVRDGGAAGVAHHAGDLRLVGLGERARPSQRCKRDGEQHGPKSRHRDIVGLVVTGLLS